MADRIGGLSAAYKSGSPVSIANKVYVKTGYSIKPQFHEIAVKNFNSETESVEFSKSQEAANKINTWVEGKTNNKIKDLISPDSLTTDTRMVLVNAIYFKGLWQNKFRTELTQKADFWTTPTESKKVDMMQTKANFKYGVIQELNCTAIELPYEGNNNLSMLILLPNERDGLAYLESKLSDVSLNDISQKMWKQEVTVWLPRFKIEFDLTLNSVLSKVGRDFFDL